jgi:uncharacterized protein (DUF433 family)
LLINKEAVMCYTPFIMAKYIVSDPTILSGMPVIQGTRVPVARILSLLKEGYTLEEIHEQFDHISIATLENALEEIAGLINQTPHGTQIL